MSAVDDILAQIPMAQLADQLGTDTQTAKRLSAQLIPTLIGGMSANAHDPAGERSLAAALNDHASSTLAAGAVLNEVDTNDGQAIVHNIAKKFTEGRGSAGESGSGQSSDGGILGGILDSLTGGGQPLPQQQPSPGGVLQDVLLDALGGLLGRGRRS